MICFLLSALPRFQGNESSNIDVAAAGFSAEEVKRFTAILTSSKARLSLKALRLGPPADALNGSQEAVDDRFPESLRGLCPGLQLLVLWNLGGAAGAEGGEPWHWTVRPDGALQGTSLDQ